MRGALSYADGRAVGVYDHQNPPFTSLSKGKLTMQSNHNCSSITELWLLYYSSYGCWLWLIIIVNYILRLPNYSSIIIVNYILRLPNYSSLNGMVTIWL